VIFVLLFVYEWADSFLGHNVQDALEILQPRPESTSDGVSHGPLNDMDDEDRAAADALSSSFGDSLTRTIGQDSAWAKSLAAVVSDVSLPS
jgi:hypothetical protein